MNSFEGLPGAELVTKGLKDIEEGVVSEFSLLLQVAAPRLKGLGIEVQHLSSLSEEPFEHQLYDFVQNNGGHSYYNSLIRRIVSFARCLERERYDLM